MSAPDLETVAIAAWLLGWAGSTIFAAVVIGNVGKNRDFPAFVWPLVFGWYWPGFLAIGLIVAPLAWLSDRTTKRQKDSPQ